MFAVSVTLFVLSAVKVLDAQLYENCYRCNGEICCDDPITDIDTLVCSYWTGPNGGAPLDVCFGSFGGAEAASVSQMYRCADDGSTVYQYQYTGCSDCSCNGFILNEFNVNFNPAANPDTDVFNCTGPPCPYYIIEDGTAHPTGECPFDVGKGGVAGGNYATWQVKLLLEGCQTSGDTSLLMKCSAAGGIEVMNFGNDRCDFDPNNGGGNTHNTTKPEYTVECNVNHQGTGRSFYCSEEEFPTTGLPTGSPVTADPTTAAPTTSAPTTAEPTTSTPTTTEPTTGDPTTAAPTTATPTTMQPSQAPLDPGQTRRPTTAAPNTAEPTTTSPTTAEPTTGEPTEPTAPTTMEPTKAPVETDDDTSTPTTAPNDVGNPSSNYGYRSKTGFTLLFMIWCVIYNR